MRRTKVLVQTGNGEGRQGIRVIGLVGAVLVAPTLGCRMGDDHGRAARAHMVISSEVTCPGQSEVGGRKASKWPLL